MTINSVNPKRGEIWFADFSPTVGREQSGLRPCVVVSANQFNESYAELVMVCPTTTKDRRIRSHIRLEAGEGGLRDVSFVKTDNLRSVSKERLRNRIGMLTGSSLNQIEQCLRFLLDL